MLGRRVGVYYVVILLLLFITMNACIMPVADRHICIHLIQPYPDGAEARGLRLEGGEEGGGGRVWRILLLLLSVLGSPLVLFRMFVRASIYMPPLLPCCLAGA